MQIRGKTNWRGGGGGDKIKKILLRRMLLPLQTRKKEKVYIVITVLRYSEIKKVS